ncbi:hypothetical protein [Streptomyces sp. NPDC059850]|uniref:hypothetical protein n=1 Tax=Streptomyces sp. NPDC059850 TaxID=3346970 RepID=UPI003657597F
MGNFSVVLGALGTTSTATCPGATDVATGGGFQAGSQGQTIHGNFAVGNPATGWQAATVNAAGVQAYVVCFTPPAP